ncbi:GNAT family N-acetyltransferase|uniref:GNAT family N-acetyltransferase n=1 Tax=Noviherbaspirillum sp. L7-7A TaxID=2850560 RepID=UPI001C2B8AAE|nr:GNAT family N-acetyltransferase [Noviherbaspirillum sp. L7-7A]MBV0878799.1 GNAT family N-acetyltransferase [Noviherbaspirillum sp. L7-7A]
MSLHIVIGPWEQQRQTAAALRHRVFVVEQGVPAELELDEMDAQSLHAVAYQDGVPVATGRLLPDGHIGRMAVRQDARGAGTGSLVLCALMDEARRRGDRDVVLHAQLSARDFYARHGFEAEGDAFMDAGIEHIAMRRRFSPG